MKKIYFETGSTNPYYNLAFEEYLFEKKDPGQQYLMLWQNSNAVIIGRHQNTLEEISSSFIDEHQIKVVRRNSGGGAVYHDSGNLNFSFIVAQNDYEVLDFSTFIKPVIAALGKLGIKAEFSGRNDILIDGKKFSGNSQYIKNGKVLHHGTIMLDSNLDMVEGALIHQKHIQSKGVKSVHSHVTNVCAHLDRKISADEFKEILKQEMFQKNEMIIGRLSDDDIAGVKDLCRKKYETWEWNYGSSPEFNLKKERRFPTGNVCVYLLVEKGKILQAGFRGDFFTDHDISELEENLIGAPVGEGLRDWLVSVEADTYIKGISADDLYQLILY